MISISDTGQSAHEIATNDREQQTSGLLITKHVGQRKQKNYNIFRCDKIQNPRPGPFNSDVLEWFPSQGLMEAFILKARVKDFIAGEERREEVRTTFRISKTDNRLETVGRKTVRYHCHFGPNDLRNPNLPPVPKKRTEENGGRPLARSTKLGTSSQRGCMCHFAIVFLDDRLEAALIRWFQRGHVDRAGAACHGPEDALAIYAHAHVAPSISDELREEVDRMLRAGVKPDVILSEHHRILRLKYDAQDVDKPEDWTRDEQLSEQDILNIKKQIDKHLYIYTLDDALAVKLFVDQNPNMIIEYTEQDKESNPKQPFMLVWSTPWMLKKLAKHGHGGLIAMDATFATNTYEFSLFTIMAFDDFQNGIPCAYGLLERHGSADLVRMLNGVKSKAEHCQEHILFLEGTWKPTSIIIDVASEEQLALGEVWPDAPILFCLWHVRRAWETNMHAKVKNPFAKAQLNDELGNLMYNREFEDTEQRSVQFIQKWASFEQTNAFAFYYYNTWHGKLSRWVKSYRHFKHSNQDTNGSIEKSHSTMKRFLAGEKKVKNGRKAGWLIHMLMHTIERFFWAKSARKWQGCIRNKIVESTVMASINKAKELSDSNVMLQVIDGKNVGFVRSSKNPDKYHTTTLYDADACTCTCVHSLQGNTCKHQIKCLLMTGWHESNLLLLLGTKKGTMCGGLDYANKVGFGRGESVPAQGAENLLDLNEPCAEVEEDCGVQTLEETTSAKANAHIPTVPELESVVSSVLCKVQGSSWLMVHAGTGLHEWEKNMFSLFARLNLTDQSNVSTPISQDIPSEQPLQRRDGVERDNSILPYAGLCDRIHKRNKGRRIPPSAATKPCQFLMSGQENMQPNQLEPIKLPKPFVKKKKLKENMSQRMFRLAEMELHGTELHYDDTTGNPVERKKMRRRGKQVGGPKATLIGLQQLQAFNQAYELSTSRGVV